MNNKLIIFVGIGAVIVLGILGFVIFGNTQSGNEAANTEATERQTTEDLDEVAQMFAGAFEGNDSIRCTYTEEGYQSTAYIKGGKMRVDTIGGSEGINGSMIYDEPIVYFWQQGTNEGYMVDTSQTDNSEVQEGMYTDPEKVRSQVEQNAPSCSRQTVSDSMFVPPSDVNFQSMDAMMDRMMEQVPEGAELPEGYEFPDGFEAPQQ